MKILADNKNGNLIIALSGELDECVADITRKTIDKILLQQKFDSVLFDMSNLAFMDSTGIGVLLGRYKIIKKLGGTAYIANCSKQIERVLTMSGIFTIMEKIG